MGNYEAVKNFRQRLKARATYVLGDKCQICGYDKCQAALEFHHLDPAKKDFSFNANTNRSWADTRSEIQKCILVCANCHREIHYGLINNNLLKSSFNEERAKEIDKLVDNLKTHKVYYCKKCGAEVSRGSEYCVKCNGEIHRVIERPSREELKQLIRTTPFTQIGKQYNVCDNTIRKWCTKYDLPNKVGIIKQYTDKEWELI